MSVEAIVKIKAAEENAQKIRMNALEESRNLISDAEKQGVGLKAQAECDGEAAVKTMIAEADQKAFAQMEQAKKNAAEKAASFMAEREKNLNAAALLIMERIVKK